MFKYLVCTCEGASAAFRASLRWKHQRGGNWGDGEQMPGMCCRGGVSFPAGLRGAQERLGQAQLCPEPGPCLVTSSLATAPRAHGTAHPSVLLLLFLQPQELHWFPARWHPGVSPSTVMARGTAGVSGNAAHDIDSSGNAEGGDVRGEGPRGHARPRGSVGTTGEMPTAERG